MNILLTTTDFINQYPEVTQKIRNREREIADIFLKEMKQKGLETLSKGRPNKGKFSSSHSKGIAYTLSIPSIEGDQEDLVIDFSSNDKLFHWLTKIGNFSGSAEARDRVMGNEVYDFEKEEFVSIT